jgi:hypothetical protein
VQRDYVVDYTSAIKNDLMVYEEGGFKTSYTYGVQGRISQMTRQLSEKIGYTYDSHGAISRINSSFEDEINPVTAKMISTTADSKGENINSNIAVEKLGKLYYHLGKH